MSLNRIIDREIDALNPRTKNRHLPAGTITLKEAYFLATISALLYFISAYFINDTAFLLSPIPAITAYIYPYLKRFTCLSHFVLGLNLAYAPIGGWIAISNSFNPLSSEFAITVLGISVIFWVAGFDMIYGLQDVEFDKKYNLHSAGAHFGVKKALLLSALSHLIFFILVVFSLLIIGLGVILRAGVIVVAILLLYQHAIVGENYSEQKIQIAFFKANALLSITLLLSIILDSLVRF